MRFLTVFCAALMLSAPVLAQDLPVTAFFGKFSGGGVAENDDSIYFAVTARDFDVEIGPAPGGFQVTWTSVIRRGGSPDQPRVRKKSTTKAFVPSATRGVYRATNSGDPLSGQELAWARVTGNTLLIYLMVLDERGAYQIQRYARKLSGTGMELTFTRVKDGEKVREVKGRLIKTAR